MAAKIGKHTRFWFKLPSGKKTFFTMTDQECADAEAKGSLKEYVEAKFEAMVQAANRGLN